MFAILGVVGVLLSIQVPVFSMSEGPAEILNYTPLGTQQNPEPLPLPQIEGYNLSYVFRDKEFEKLSKQELSTAYAYGSTDKSKPTVWVSIEIAQTAGPLHRWETCLVNYPISQGVQPKVTQIESKDIQTQSNPPKVARYFAFEQHNTNKTQVVLYWYETATFNVNGTAQEKNVKISLSIYPNATQDLSHVKDQLIPIATTINNHWQSIKTWTPVALTLSQNGLAMSAVMVTVLGALLVYKLLLGLQEKKASVIVYNKMPNEIQLLTQATIKAQKQKNPTNEKITEELQNLTNTSINLTEINQSLEKMENVGLIKKKVGNNSDNPVVQWKHRLPSTSFFRFLKKVTSLFSIF